MSSKIKEQSVVQPSEYEERMKELLAFDSKKSGIKGLVDSDVVNIPKIFIRSVDELEEELNHVGSNLQVPVIDMSLIETDKGRQKIVNEIKQASKDWGFFQVLNHGIPRTVLDNMLDGVRRFHEQDAETKQEYYSRDPLRKIRYASNIDLYRSQSANWRDTLTISAMFDDHIEPSEMPAVCRDPTIVYMNQVTQLGKTLFDILSEALGLKRDHLRSIGCDKGRALVCHYYPSCPQPDLTLGTCRHTDPPFITILLQDQIGGLQIIRDNQWIDIQPLEGSLVINIGDLMQIVSNDVFKSVEHRVLANRVGPRISVATFFTGTGLPHKVYGPIKELTSEENPPLYKELNVLDYVKNFYSRSIGKSGLDLFRL